LTCALLLAGCATIVGGGTSQTVTINSEPVGATFAVKSSSGIVMSQGKAPQTIKLPRKNEYQIEVSAPGYQAQSFALTKGLNGWVFGNLIIGWIPGFIVDFAGGAANKLEPSLVQVNLAQSTSDASSALEGSVTFLTEKGQLVAEKHIRLEPIAADNAAR